MLLLLICETIVFTEIPAQRLWIIGLNNCHWLHCNKSFQFSAVSAENWKTNAVPTSKTVARVKVRLAFFDSSEYQHHILESILNYDFEQICATFERNRQNAQTRRSSLDFAVFALNLNRQMDWTGTVSHVWRCCLLLARLGFSIDKKPLRYTSLHIACGFACENTLFYLIERGFDVEAKDSFGPTPLHCVCTAHSARHLIDAGANVSVCDNNEKSVLLNVFETVSLCLVLAPNARDSNGRRCCRLDWIACQSKRSKQILAREREMDRFVETIRFCSWHWRCDGAASCCFCRRRRMARERHSISNKFEWEEKRMESMFVEKSAFTECSTFHWCLTKSRRWSLQTFVCLIKTVSQMFSNANIGVWLSECDWEIWQIKWFIDLFEKEEGELWSTKNCFRRRICTKCACAYAK